MGSRHQGGQAWFCAFNAANQIASGINANAGSSGDQPLAEQVRARQSSSVKAKRLTEPSFCRPMAAMASKLALRRASSTVAVQLGVWSERATDGGMQHSRRPVTMATVPITEVAQATISRSQLKNLCRFAHMPAPCIGGLAGLGGHIGLHKQLVQDLHSQ